MSFKFIAAKPVPAFKFNLVKNRVSVTNRVATAKAIEIEEAPAQVTEELDKETVNETLALFKLEEGKTVRFDHDGVKLAGVIAKLANGVATVRLAIPDEDGLLLASDSSVDIDASKLTVVDAPYVERKMVTWQSNESLLQDGMKGVAIKDQSNRIVDYSDVMIAGYGSTFGHVTAKDRDGDTVMVGAFTETIREFKRNPVMLIDHKNSVENIAGSYTEVMQDDIGLRVIGKVSNAPELRTVRFLIMEGHLKTLSMGGVFLYGPDGHTIEKVYLFEISLVAIPANPDALFQARSLDLTSASKLFKRHSAKSTLGS